jgi:hypothetical protein
MDAAVRTLAGSARSMGLDVEGVKIMAKLTKRQKAIKATLVVAGKLYGIEDAVNISDELACS